MHNSTLPDDGLVTITTDILGPGIIIGYVALCISTFLIVIKPGSFKGTGNGMASIIMALGYSISSVIQTHRTLRYPEEADKINLKSLAFATCMTSIALAFASISMLSRGKIPVRADNPGWSNGNYRRRDLFVLAYRKVPAPYMGSFIILEIICLGLGVYATQQYTPQDIDNSQNPPHKNRFIVYLPVLLFIQSLLVIYSAIASMSQHLKRHRWVTFGVSFGVFVASLAFMFWARAHAQVLIQLDDWTYGQTFNGATGCAGLATTLVDWLSDDDSEGEK
ncbi:hypothetical protein PILCRDRAFT_88249 [Piloderma croceum F 1598]|uniref:Uncharacterized protein n=1 Tax=Piloderma croceum (strain F 1598) TaxID=765440 RepID=A0A0C3B9G9_PILCF|nr:hypothetical protein PILCRDRAFT_88249 [Piloderma croceum F 1598]